MQFHPSRLAKDVIEAAEAAGFRAPAAKEVTRLAGRKVLALPSDEVAYEVPDNQVRNFLICAVNALDQKAETIEELSSAERAASGFGAIKPTAYANAVESLGQLVPKFAEPKISRVGDSMPTAFGVGLPDTAYSPIHASSRTIDARVRMTFCGNAADMRTAKLFCAHWRRPGGPSEMLLETLAANERGARDILVGLGADAEHLDAAVTRFRERREAELSEVSAIEARMKCVFVPVGGDYVQVSPVPSVAAYTEVAQRIRERRAEGRRVPASYSVISSKPQNAGMHASFVDGHIPRLHARYRPIDQLSHWRKLVAVQKGAPFFQESMLRDVPALTRYAELIAPLLGSSDGEAYRNADIVAGISHQGERVGEALVAWLHEFQAFCVETRGTLDPDATTGSGWLLDVCVHGRRGWEPTDIEAAADEAARIAVRAVRSQSRGLRGAAGMSDQLSRDLKSSIHRVFERELG